MKVALLISGYLRTFKENLPILKSRILEKFDNVDVYIHITKNGNKEDKYLNTSNDIDYISKVLNPVCLLCEDNQVLSNNKQINNTLNLWFKYHKLNEIKKENEEIKGKYDLVIKYRPDMNVITEDIFIGDIVKNVVYLPIESKIDKSKLAHKDDKYICDIFAYGNSTIMNYYFEIYEYLNILINEYKTNVSETLLHNYLLKYCIPFKKLDINYTMILSKCNVFAITGDSGSGKTTLGNILKKYFSSSFMLECDRYHKWERKDDNWKNYTHLNPEANYLTKMNEDIFDLKIGKSVYQVDYDHSSGKFTAPEKIESSDNIIVCGLHSLYSKDDSVFDIKIFIDTDITLKYNWKIKRDMAKRGYTKEAILQQIENRKEDYIKYILPQRENSDIIINFFTDKEFGIDKIDEPLDIKLKVLLSNKFIYQCNYHRYANIFAEFKRQGIEFKSSMTNRYTQSDIIPESDKFSEIIFNSYKEHNLGFNNNNYYDYILFIILNLNK